MTDRERHIHAVAFETAQAVERVVPFPRNKRAMVFFAVFSRIKQALERLSAEDRLKPGRN
jgi:hypothetical protein